MNQKRQVGVLFLGFEQPWQQRFFDRLERSYDVHRRYARGDATKLSGFAEQLVGLPCDVIVAIDTPSGRAAEAATNTIPIVELMCHIHDERINVTGLTDDLTSGLIDQRLAMLIEFLESNNRPVSPLAVLWNDDNPASISEVERLTTLARHSTNPIDLLRLPMRGPGHDVATAMADANGASALVVFEDPVIVQYRAELLDLASHARLPTMFETRLFVDGGGLVSYGIDRPAAFQRLVDYVDAILGSSSLAAQSGTFSQSVTRLPAPTAMAPMLFLNGRTAQRLGLAPVPSALCGVEMVCVDIEEAAVLEGVGL